MKMIQNVAAWIFALFMLISGMVFVGESPSTGILCFFGAVLSAPITWKIIEKSRKKVTPIIKIILPIVVFLGAIIISPSNNTDALLLEMISEIPDVESYQVVGREAMDGGALFSSMKSSGRTEEIHQDDKTHSLENLEIHFMDVGQGSSTLIRCGSKSMLIDAGDDSKGTAIQNYLQKQGIEKLDYLVLTHPDMDHIGGAPVIITKFDIDTVFMSNYEKDNQTYMKLIQALDNKRLEWLVPDVGSSYPLGSAVITILAPNRTYRDPNNASIALLVQNGNNSVLFTGDAEEEAENDILLNGMEFTADIYHVGHHGSKTSTGESFLDFIHPTYAVISCEEGNSYGHPHAQTLNRLRERGISVFRTDEQGSIIATLSGSEITWNCSPSDTWQAGEPTGISGKNKSNSSQKGWINAGNDLWAPLQKQEAELPPEEPIVAEEPVSNSITYVLNSKTMKFHKPSCSNLPTANRSDSTSNREELIGMGYEACKKCRP